MQDQKLSKVAIDTFIYFYKQFLEGKKGLISEAELNPIPNNEIPLWEKTSEYSSIGEQVLNKTVVIKLNGGLGTTMGLVGPKSLVPVKNQLSFLDITALQIITLNKKIGSSIPLILMNSFKTEQASIEALKKYPDIFKDLPVSFIQNMFPRIDASTLAPANFPCSPQLEWNPSGHGDIYTSIFTTGILQQLIDRGYKYAFVSNIDNLGASLDTGILGYFAINDFSFLMEVTERTWMDRKGGHLARNKNGKLILREASQCPKENLNDFQDISRHSFFNTNNLWINLIELHNHLIKNDSINLPMICSRKKIDPTDPDSKEVFQIESAMGTAISVFENASALKVPRSRFAPVKNCEDLLLLWSDSYILDDNFLIVRNPDRRLQTMDINLDPLYYSWIEQLQQRFPHEPPSLLECNSLKILGDIKFGKNIRISGDITICNRKNQQVVIPDFKHIDNNLYFD